MVREVHFSKSGDFLPNSGKFCLGYHKWKTHNQKYFLILCLSLQVTEETQKEECNYFSFAKDIWD